MQSRHVITILMLLSRTRLAIGGPMVTLTPWLERQWSFTLPVAAFPAVLERLVGTPARAAAMVSGMPEPDLEMRPRGKWSIKEHLGHLSDLHQLDMQRVGQFLAGAPVLDAADQSNQRTESAGHANTPISQLLMTFGQQREQLFEQLRTLSEREVAATALHPRLGITLRLIDWAQFVAEHDDHHLASARYAMWWLGQRTVG
jgi:hypothetical protein